MLRSTALHPVQPVLILFSAILSLFFTSLVFSIFAPVHGATLFQPLVIREGYSGRTLKAMSFYRDSLYIAVEEGLLLYDGRRISNVSDRLWPVNPRGINDICGGTRLWIASDRGFFSIKSKKGEDHSKARGFVGNRALLVHEGQGKRIAVITDRAILVGFFYGKELVFQTIPNPPGNFSTRGVRQMLLGGRDLWLATGNGLYAFNGETWRRYTTRDGLPSDDITCLEFDTAGRIWVGTTGIFSGGMAYLNKGSWRVQGRDQGLPSHRVHSIAADRGVIWAATENGLARYDGRSWITYGSGEGLARRSPEKVVCSSRYVIARIVDKDIGLLCVLDKLSDPDQE